MITSLRDGGEFGDEHFCSQFGIVNELQAAAHFVAQSEVSENTECWVCESSWDILFKEEMAYPCEAISKDGRNHGLKNRSMK